MALAKPKRADARRNYDQIVAAAEAEIARHGADASLEEIARRAGVGSATLHRHFPSRQALLEAVFHDRVEVLCEQARELAGQADPGAALGDWLRAVARYGATTRGLARSLLDGGRAVEAPPDSTCETMLVDAGGELLQRAHAAGRVRAEVSIVDLLTLVNAISLATEGSPDAAAEATRLTDLALEGVRPRS
ncbi:TetR/AcrR family transcriptional regulator [Actinoplanes sp. TRM 88003]|uniref:TetR/AcrR family transcriptional regulator n=1 Tax=Paractinoplanes aksuensis TaxID=2939490 RepID=A0ABT1DRM9_9ACTN|nr:TetR/AcrR family transcriptional regulator [Actinoplanes aksuensis]MCO8273482.1 TetR/AcrR family transcriptional regulator [Actinoplanes aksuensis]